MIGHNELIEIRRQGLKPAAIWIMDLGEPPRNKYLAAENQMQLGCLPEIHIRPQNNLTRLALPFLVGMTVHISSTCIKRARLLYAAAKRGGARIIIVTDGQTFTHYENNTENKA